MQTSNILFHHLKKKVAELQQHYTYTYTDYDSACDQIWQQVHRSIQVSDRPAAIQQEPFQPIRPSLALVTATGGDLYFSMKLAQ